MIEDRKINLENNKKVVLQTKKQHYREAREKILPSLDVEFFKALEDYLLNQSDLPDNLKNIIDKKRELRDVTNLTVDSFSDEIDIMDYTPPCLK